MDIDWMTAAVAGCWAFTATIALRLRRDIRDLRGQMMYLSIRASANPMTEPQRSAKEEKA